MRALKSKLHFVTIEFNHYPSLPMNLTWVSHGCHPANIHRKSVMLFKRKQHFVGNRILFHSKLTK